MTEKRMAPGKFGDWNFGGTMKLTIGSFSIDDGDQIIAPAEYMEARGLELLQVIADGDDPVFEEMLRQYASAEEATLHRLDADYAGWHAEPQR